MVGNRKLGGAYMGMRLCVAEGFQQCIASSIVSRPSHCQPFLIICSTEMAWEIFTWLFELLTEAKGSGDLMQGLCSSYSACCCCSGQKNTCMGKIHHYEWCSIYTFCLFPSVHFHRAKNWCSYVDADKGGHELCSVQTQETILKELLLSKEYNRTCMVSVKPLFCMYYHSIYIWHATVWLNHG